MPIDPNKLAAMVEEKQNKRPKFPPPKVKPMMRPNHEEDEDEGGGEDGGDLTDDEKMADEVAKAMKDGKRNKRLDKLMADFDPDDNPPVWVADEDTWERAKEAVDPEGRGGDYDEPWAVVAYVYERMGGKVK